MKVSGKGEKVEGRRLKGMKGKIKRRRKKLRERGT